MKLAVAGLDDVLDLTVVKVGPIPLVSKLVHTVYEIFQVVFDDEINSMFLKVLDGDCAFLAEDSRQKLPPRFYPVYC